MSSEINKNLAILGLRPGAKQIEIRNSFKNLTLIYHPDVPETGSAEKYLEIKDAYEALFDNELYEKELEDLKKDPEEYYRTRAKFPMAFDENEHTNDKTASGTTRNVKTTSKQNKSKKTTKTLPKKKGKNNGDITPYCIGGGIVAEL